MVCPPCSRYEAHPQLRQQECLLYFLLHRSRVLCSFSPPCSPFIFLSRPDLSKFNRRRGFSNRATAAMFVATAINFLLASLNTGAAVAEFVVVVRRALILDIDYSPAENQELIDNALANVYTISAWAETLPVSIKLLIPDPVPTHTRRRCCSAISSSFGELGSSSQIDSG